MDVWRYSDWDGYQKEVRESKPHIWRWRDWIVESLNADKGYDRMIVEMLAADEAEPDDPKALRATGFLARNWYKFNRNSWLDNTVEHTAKAFLGMTFNCARCHDHKYDPIEHADYYRLRAFFEPHQIRTDRVPGQADVEADGLVRVFDADADAKTYLFLRGDETQPAKDKPLTPGLPKALSRDGITIQPVPLPRSSTYPGLGRVVREETLGEAREGLRKAEALLAKARGARSSLRETRRRSPTSRWPRRASPRRGRNGSPCSPGSRPTPPGMRARPNPTRTPWPGRPAPPSAGRPWRRRTRLGSAPRGTWTTPSRS